MKIIIWFLLFNLVELNLADRGARNMFTDFIDNLMPGRTRREYSNCQCGLNDVRTGRVVNGSNANSQPWHAALFIESTKQQFCSATLINSRWLVTAFHCLMSETTSSLRVLMGTSTIGENQVAKANFVGNPLESDESGDYLEESENKRSLLELLYKLDENGNKTFLFDWNQLIPFNLDSVQIFKAKRFVFNREFERTYFKNDIALIELDRDVRLSNSIRPICLLNQSLYLDDELNGSNNENENLINNVITNGFNEQDKKKDLNANTTNAFENEERFLMHHQFEAYGFGRIGYNKPGSRQLQKVTFRYEKLDRCKNIWQSKISLYGNLIDETHLCVMNRHSTICHGDSGTGLTLKLKSNGNSTTNPNQKERNYLAGIASAGYYCSLDTPPLFTRLSKQLNFINSNVNSGYWCKN